MAQHARHLCLPLLGDLAVAEIGVADVRRVLEPIWLIKPETASRVRGRIEAVIAAARADDDSRWANPARWERHRHLFPKRSKIAPTRHHPALPYKDVPQFIRRLRAKDGIAARALEVTILTALRTKEALGARFDEFDLAAKVWRIPAARMKADKPHQVPLCNRVVAIVKKLAATRINEFVFPNIKRGKPLSNISVLLRDMHPRRHRARLPKLVSGLVRWAPTNRVRTLIKFVAPYTDLLLNIGLAW
jgi:integrase